jgi:hypothetical protein
MGHVVLIPFRSILLTLWTNFQSFHSLTHPECGAACHIGQYFKNMQHWTIVAVNVVRCCLVTMLPTGGTAPSVQSRDFCVPSRQTVSHWIGQVRGRARRVSMPMRCSERRRTVNCPVDKDKACAGFTTWAPSVSRDFQPRCGACHQSQ